MTPLPTTPCSRLFHAGDDGTWSARLGRAVDVLRVEAALRDKRLSYATSIRKHRRGTREYVVTVFPTRLPHRSHTHGA